MALSSWLKCHGQGNYFISVKMDLDDQGIGGGEYEMSKKVEAKLGILI